MTHMALDEKTGMDPKGIRLRAAAGLEAVDFFMPGYHVWAKIIEALADVGYDSNSIVSVAVPLLAAVPAACCLIRRPPAVAGHHTYTAPQLGVC